LEIISITANCRLHLMLRVQKGSVPVTTAFQQEFSDTFGNGLLRRHFS
jgi:hypothetical protein